MSVKEIRHLREKLDMGHLWYTLVNSAPNSSGPGGAGQRPVPSSSRVVAQRLNHFRQLCLTEPGRMQGGTQGRAGCFPGVSSLGPALIRGR